MARIQQTIHMSINIRGMLRHFKGRSMKGLMTKDDGTPASDEEVKIELYNHLAQGHNAIPMGHCDNFDYVNGKCLGHNIKYFDENDNEITKEEYERIIAVKTENE